MIKSMTGYGSAKGEAAGLALSVELKSVNNRYLDVSVKLPRALMFAEEPIRSAVAKHISRGKVDVFVTADAGASDSVEVRLNSALLRGYLEAVNKARAEIAGSCGVADDVSIMSLCRMPDVLSTERRELDADELTRGLLAILEEALAGYDAMREREGARLRDDVCSRLDEIERLTGAVERRSPQTVAEYRARLEAKLRDTLEGIPADDARVLTECAIFADRVAVDEETVRLRSHISQLRGMAEGASPIGRKMDFLIQELNRESNTIGSKCQSADIARVVVDLKAEIEKIREQIQNVE